MDRVAAMLMLLGLIVVSSMNYVMSAHKHLHYYISPTQMHLQTDYRPIHACTLQRCTNILLLSSCTHVHTILLYC